MTGSCGLGELCGYVARSDFSPCTVRTVPSPPSHWLWSTSSPYRSRCPRPPATAVCLCRIHSPAVDSGLGAGFRHLQAVFWTYSGLNGAENESPWTLVFPWSDAGPSSVGEDALVSAA